MTINQASAGFEFLVLFVVGSSVLLQSGTFVEASLKAWILTDPVSGVQFIQKIKHWKVSPGHMK